MAARTQRPQLLQPEYTQLPNLFRYVPEGQLKLSKVVHSVSIIMRLREAGRPRGDTKEVVA